jgi:hypothetical protein
MPVSMESPCVTRSRSFPLVCTSVIQQRNQRHASSHNASHVDHIIVFLRECRLYDMCKCHIQHQGMKSITHRVKHTWKKKLTVKYELPLQHTCSCFTAIFAHRHWYMLLELILLSLFSDEIIPFMVIMLCGELMMQKTCWRQQQSHYLVDTFAPVQPCGWIYWFCVCIKSFWLMTAEICGNIAYQHSICTLCSFTDKI